MYLRVEVIGMRMRALVVAIALGLLLSSAVVVAGLPPTGTTNISRSGKASSISKAMVPCPAIIFSSSYGWMRFKPLSLASSSV